MTRAVVFDLDGVLIRSEEVWDRVRERYVRERGGRYDGEVQRAMMGMSSPEWSRYLHEEAGVPDAPQAIAAEVVSRMLAAYHEELPLLPGAVEAVRRTATLAPLAECFRVTLSSEEGVRGKPAPAVYLEAARRLGVPPDECAAVEDSHSGIRSARAAGMRVIAIPNPSYPPDEEALAEADATIGSLAELTAATLGL